MPSCYVNAVLYISYVSLPALQHTSQRRRRIIEDKGKYWLCLTSKKTKAPSKQTCEPSPILGPSIVYQLMLFGESGQFINQREIPYKLKSLYVQYHSACLHEPLTLFREYAQVGDGVQLMIVQYEDKFNSVQVFNILPSGISLIYGMSSDVTDRTLV